MPLFLNLLPSRPLCRSLASDRIDTIDMDTLLIGREDALYPRIYFESTLSKYTLLPIGTYRKSISHTKDDKHLQICF